MTNQALQTTPSSRLYSAASYHARSALDLAKAPWHEHSALDIATHAGAVIEMLAKTLLLSHDHRLIAKNHAHHHLLDAVLRATGQPLPEFRGSGAATVDAAVAVELVQRLDLDISRHARSAIKVVLAARNDAVHMAIPRDPKALEAVLAAMSDFADSILKVLSLAPQAFWGTHTGAVRSRADAHHAEVLLSARDAIAAAKREYDQLHSTIGAESWDKVLAVLQQRGAQESGDIDAGVTCPACGNGAGVTWSIEADAEPGDDGESVYSAYYVLEGLYCPACSLRLDADQVESLELKDMPDEHDIAQTAAERDFGSYYE